ncbi:AMP-binding protein [Nocardioides insulae]|uniref:AMP-binding protein n=1 Tax=Nocardioides insulae TaxID=394734 RepID=UPI000402689C|nr:AMP-binding protein [Nocardioides insulae]
MFVPEEGFPIGNIPAAYAERIPDTVAVRCAADELTWRELDAASDAAARGLREYGVRPGAIVTLVLPTGTDIVVAAYACLRAGATPQPLSPKLAPAEAAAILELAGSAAVITTAEPPEGLAGATTTTLADLTALGAGTPALGTLVAPSWKAPTSGGSTGRPKIILAGKPALFSPTDGDLWRIGPGERALITAPLHHNAPFSNTLIALNKGATVTLLPRFDAEGTLAAIERDRITWLYVVPTMMRRIIALDEETRSGYDLSSLRDLWHCAEPCPRWLKRAFIDWLGADRIWELYAGTEAQAGTQISGTEWLEHPGSVGRIHWGEAKVMAADGTEADPGTPGEIFMRVAPGNPDSYRYLGAEAREVDGWSSLGDMGHFDADGYLYLGDRRSDMITVGGVNVYPAEVEAALVEHPCVHTSVVIGLPDADRGNRVHAIVSLAPDAEASAEELAEFLRPRLSVHKLPRSIEFVDEPLRDEAGKVRRSALRAERLTT